MLSLQRTSCKSSPLDLVPKRHFESLPRDIHLEIGSFVGKNFVELDALFRNVYHHGLAEERDRYRELFAQSLEGASYSSICRQSHPLGLGEVARMLDPYIRGMVPTKRKCLYEQFMGAEGRGWFFELPKEMAIDLCALFVDTQVAAKERASKLAVVKELLKLKDGRLIDADASCVAQSVRRLGCNDRAPLEESQFYGIELLKRKLSQGQMNSAWTVVHFVDDIAKEGPPNNRYLMQIELLQVLQHYELLSETFRWEGSESDLLCCLVLPDRRIHFAETIRKNLQEPNIVVLEVVRLLPEGFFKEECLASIASQVLHTQSEKPKFSVEFLLCVVRALPKDYFKKVQDPLEIEQYSPSYWKEQRTYFQVLEALPKEHPQKIALILGCIEKLCGSFGFYGIGPLLKSLLPRGFFNYTALCLAIDAVDSRTRGEGALQELRELCKKSRNALLVEVPEIELLQV